MAFLTINAKNYLKQGGNLKPFVWLKKLWTSIINIGIDENMALWDRKRIRLLNGICTMGTIAQSWYVFSYTAPSERWIFWEAFQSAVFYVLIIFLNYFKKHNFACHLFCIYNIVNYSWMAFSHGQVDGSEYFLLPSGMAAMLFFKNIRVIVSYFVLNLAFFWLCKYSFSQFKPLIVLPFDTYIPNQTILFIITFLVVYYFKSENFRQETLLYNQNLNLEEEKLKSEKLLLNILPQETAEELKATGTAKTKFFEQVTVMFTDFHDFTPISEKMHPEELVAEINYYFSAFDNIVSRHEIEKIKTIGDSYMCAAGLPNRNTTHAIDTVKAAIEILDFMEERKTKKQALGQPWFDVRIGIHTGPIVAGIVGTRKFAYDIWGDTVNMASRMESSSEVGMINISGATHELIKDAFNCTYRGKINAKNKGMIDMYYVKRETSNVNRES
jgi:class 3 adenylate cyclase